MPARTVENALPLWLSVGITLASPKSRTLTLPRAVTITFAGFRSLCRRLDLRFIERIGNLNGNSKWHRQAGFLATNPAIQTLSANVFHRDKLVPSCSPIWYTCVIFGWFRAKAVLDSRTKRRSRSASSATEAR